MTGELQFACGAPAGADGRVTMAHGGGGRLMHDLIERVFVSAMANEALIAGHDAAELSLPGARLAMTTDSFVVHPLFFPGGDIGSLAVHGTVNDLAMCGARPLCLSAGWILEEGVPIETVSRLAESMGRAAQACGVRVVTGDTKVVDRGRGDGVYLNTAGIGAIEHNLTIAPRSVRPGDAVLVSGDLGRHGIAVMAVREGLEFECEIRSDAAPLWGIVRGLLAAGIEVHCLRDLTRGGLATALNEIAETAGVAIEVDERTIPVCEQVRGACEILGLDPLYVACEGRFVAFVPGSQADDALAHLREFSVDAARIGGVAKTPTGRVTMRSAIGASRLLDMLSGEQLPRIC